MDKQRAGTGSWCKKVAEVEKEDAKSVQRSSDALMKILKDLTENKLISF